MNMLTKTELELRVRILRGSEMFRASIFFGTLFSLAMLAFSASFLLLLLILFQKDRKKKSGLCSSDFEETLGFPTNVAFLLFFFFENGICIYFLFPLVSYFPMRNSLNYFSLCAYCKLFEFFFSRKGVCCVSNK